MMYILKINKITLRLHYINKITLSSNDDKRLQTFGRITSYPYGESAGKVCKTDLLSKANMK